MAIFRILANGTIFSLILISIFQCVPPKNAEDGLGSSSPDSCLEEDMVQLNLLSEDESDH